MTRKLSARPWARQVAACLETYGDRCHLCGHGWADSADHITPRDIGGLDTLDNLRPVHHKRCPVCGVRCNEVRGAKPLTDDLRRQFIRMTRRSVDNSRWFV